MKLSVRALKNKEGKRFIEGYASLFNVQSRMISEGGKTFREIIKTGAFNDVIANDSLNVIANIDHDMARMLGRTSAKTLKLHIDSRGLYYKIDVPDTQLGNDVYEQVERGDFYESSFSFGTRHNDVEWTRDRSDGVLLRNVNNVALLRDIAIVQNGAYSDTEVFARSDDEVTKIANIMQELKVGEYCGNLCSRNSGDYDELEVTSIRNEDTTEADRIAEENRIAEEAEAARIAAEEALVIKADRIAAEEIIANEEVVRNAEFLENKLNEISNLVKK